MTAFHLQKLNPPVKRSQPKTKSRRLSPRRARGNHIYKLSIVIGQSHSRTHVHTCAQILSKYYVYANVYYYHCQESQAAQEATQALYNVVDAAVRCVVEMVIKIGDTFKYYYWIIAATDCYIISIICTTHYLLVYLSMFLFCFWLSSVK